jgi:hypothetical protein
MIKAVKIENTGLLGKARSSKHLVINELLETKHRGTYRYEKRVSHRQV